MTSSEKVAGCNLGASATEQSRNPGKNADWMLDNYRPLILWIWGELSQTGRSVVREVPGFLGGADDRATRGRKATPN